MFWDLTSSTLEMLTANGTRRKSRSGPRVVRASWSRKKDCRRDGVVSADGMIPFPELRGQDQRIRSVQQQEDLCGHHLWLLVVLRHSVDIHRVRSFVRDFQLHGEQDLAIHPILRPRIPKQLLSNLFFQLQPRFPPLVLSMAPRSLQVSRWDLKTLAIEPLGPVGTAFRVPRPTLPTR